MAKEPGSDSMRIKAIAPWFGGKRTLAPEIVREFGSHRGYCEPFCGGLSVLLAKPPCSMEIVNDLHRDVINLARVLASNRWSDLHERVSRTLMASDLFIESKEVLGLYECETASSVSEVSDRHIERAYWFLVYSWQGRNGVSGTGGFNQHLARRFTIGGGHGPIRWTGVIDSLPSWADRLRSVTIENMDSFTLIERLEDADYWIIYCDPPYLVKGAKYVHDFESSDHERLAKLLSRFKKTRVVVSYYADERLAELYPGWTMRRLKATKAMVNQGMRDKGGAVEAPEVLLINGPSLVESNEPSLFA